MEGPDKLDLIGKAVLVRVNDGPGRAGRQTPFLDSQVADYRYPAQLRERSITLVELS